MEETRSLQCKETALILSFPLQVFDQSSMRDLYFL